MVVAGQLINILTYGALTKRDTLVTSGPYAWTRNPFYVGTFLSDFGMCVMCDPTKPFTLAIIVGYAVIQGLFYYQQVLKEEKLLGEMHGEAYSQYCRRVPTRLIPSPISAIRNRGFSFTWSGSLALHNKVFSRSLSAGFWIIAFWALNMGTGNGRTYLLSFSGLDFSGLLTNGWFILTALAIVAAYAVFRILESHKRRKEAEALEGAAEEAASGAGTSADLGEVSEA